MTLPAPPDVAAEAPDRGQAWDRCMRRGEWDAAWQISDALLAARRSIPRDWSAPRHLQAIWDGTSPRGRRVLVRCYHGLGDTIQSIRLVPPVAAMASALTVWAQPALIPLLETMSGIGRLLPLHDGTPEVPFDVDVEIMELAHLLRVTPETLPGRVPYLHPPCTPPPPRGAGGVAVGVVWRAGDWDRDRSVPPSQLRRIAAIPGVTLHLLQRGPGRAEAPPDLGLSSGSDDMLRTACLMASLDLILSVDSMPSHLAGALGLPIWTLLQAKADWRWMEARSDSPWYPIMRLFRQDRPGDWETVIARVADALRALVAERRRG